MPQVRSIWKKEWSVSFTLSSLPMPSLDTFHTLYFNFLVSGPLPLDFAQHPSPGSPTGTPSLVLPAPSPSSCQCSSHFYAALTTFTSLTSAMLPHLYSGHLSFLQYLCCPCGSRLSCCFLLCPNSTETSLIFKCSASQPVWLPVYFPSTVTQWTSALSMAQFFISYYHQLVKETMLKTVP